MHDQTSSGQLNISEQIALSSHRVSLLEKLVKVRDRGLRTALHEQITQVSHQLGLSVPPLDSIGRADPLPTDKIEILWEALRRLDELDVRYNHSRKPEMLLALHWISLQKLLRQHGISLRLDSQLKKDIKLCSQPKFVASKPVDSALESGSVRCFVFSLDGSTG